MLPIVLAHSQVVRQRGPVALLAPFKRDDSDDQEHQDQQDRDVEAREQRRVPGREGGERSSRGEDQPHLVAVPHRPDGLEHEAAFALVAGEDREQHPDAEVEPLEQEVAPPKDGDQDEPEDLESHVTLSVAGCRFRPRHARSGAEIAALADLRRVDAGVAPHQEEVDDAEREVKRTNTPRLVATVAVLMVGETACEVFSRFCTIHGWRPISVRIQPKVAAM